MRIALEPFFIILPLVLVAIWITLYSAQRVRHDHYYHDAPKAPQRLTTRPTTYVVVEDRKSTELVKIQAGLADISKMLKG